MRRLLSIAILGILCNVAEAQSSVILYGIVDVGLSYVNNTVSGGHSGSQVSMASGNVQGDRWGLRGTEDLGGALKALFVLEGGMTVNNGALAQGGDLFGRQAYVGISSALGTVTLGRQYDSVVDYTAVFASTSQWSSRYGSHPGNLDNNLPAYLVNNSIKYTSRPYRGIIFGGVFGFGGVPGEFSRNSIWSAGVGYAHGPFSAGIAYININYPNYSFFGNNANSSATGSNMASSAVISGYASAAKQQVLTSGLAYVIGGVTLGATYSNVQFKRIGTLPELPAMGIGGDARFHNVEFNFKYRVTPFLLVGIAHNYMQGYGVNNAKYNQTMCGFDYFLSKRTDLYLVGVYQHASGIDSTGRRAVANISTLSPSSTANQTIGALGIRQKF
ncbi:porin [Caballeronia sp. J97]|uniref:porin n=1 Tax=Caballeronia sp. J97 TaxID=2805429 RepID=UPI002AB32155|nr:porin [Caballeronia sp. J97]